jgi:hypothetical protein
MKLIPILLLAAAPAFGCTSTEWNSDHKKIHFVGEAVATLIAINITGDTAKGVLIGAGIGLAREIQKKASGYDCEWSSMAWDALGIGLGVAGSKVFVSPTQGGAKITYAREF